ncbi:hypothetical protein ACP70R_005683 [Stipagrostis hirtigluma subsp. patula]
MASGGLEPMGLKLLGPKGNRRGAAEDPGDAATGSRSIAHTLGSPSGSSRPRASPSPPTGAIASVPGGLDRRPPVRRAPPSP